MKDPVDPNAMAREESIFDAAVQLTDSLKRSAFLDQACAGDQALRARIEKLLAAADDPFFDKPLGPPPPVGLSAAPIEPVAAGTYVASDLSSEAQRERIGRYKLLQKIGEGGCGVVYMAEQTEPVRRRVALKVIKLGMDTESVIARFEAERQALALMDHSNIAKVLDAGATEAGRPYFVMELVRGLKITDFCDQNQLNTRQRLELFIQICQAIQHAHQKGIIHRDIKPSNILVTVNDGVPVPKVIDFGIAKATAGQQLTDKTLFTAFEQFIGTPAYMSPEQAVMTSLDVDTRSDIYSLGVLLYELLTGSTPFDAKELMASGIDAMRKTICEKEPARPSTRLTQLGSGPQSKIANLKLQIEGDLDWIVMKSLEKDRNRRYETANGLALDIQRHLNDEPVMAGPPSAVYRFGKAVRRNKLAFTAMTAIVGALLLGALVSTWQAVCATRSSEAAKKAEAKATSAETSAREKAVQLGHLLYVANMNRAQQAWEQNNVGLLRQLLEETQDSPELGFEWFYWRRQTHLDTQTLRGHLEAVISVAFSKDGQRIYTGGEDNSVGVLDVASGRELLRLKGARPMWPPVAFSPDGQRMVTSSGDNSARVLDTASGRELLKLKGHSSGVCALAFSPDGQRIVTGSSDKTAKVWNARTGQALLTLAEHTGTVSSVAFSRDGQRIVTGSNDNTAKLWNAASGQVLLTLTGHRAVIEAVAFSPDGQRIVTGSKDQTARIWDAASGHQLLAPLEHSLAIEDVAFSPDGNWIVTGSGDQTAKMWEATTGHELFTLKGHSSAVYAVAFSPDGQQIVTGSGDKTAKVWNAAGPREALMLQGRHGQIWAIAFSPDGKRIVTGNHDTTATVWNAVTGQAIQSLIGHTGPIIAVAFSPDGQRIVTSSIDQTARVWDATDGHQLLAPLKHSLPIDSAVFSPDGARILTAGRDNLAKVWDANNGELLLPITTRMFPGKGAAFSPDGKRIVTGSWNNTAKVWDALTGQELLTLKGHSLPILSVAFSRDGQRIVTGSDDITAKVWDATSGRVLLTLKGHGDVIVDVAFSPDGQRIVTGSYDRTAKVWELATGREVLTFKGSGPVISLAFSPDGQRIATASDGQAAKIWEAARADQVAAWQSEERTAFQALEVMQRERTADEERERVALARDEGRIKHWLILAPTSLAAGQSGAQGLEVEQIESEARLRPKVGETIFVGNDERRWRDLALREDEGYTIDFNMLLGQVTTQSVAYAVCYIRSETEQRGLELLVGSDEQAKVYLNGKQIHKSPFAHDFAPDQDRAADLTLNAGTNVLVLKVVHKTGGWKGSVRLTDPQGNPVQGIKVTLAP